MAQKDAMHIITIVDIVYHQKHIPVYAVNVE